MLLFFVLLTHLSIAVVIVNIPEVLPFLRKVYEKTNI